MKTLLIALMSVLCFGLTSAFAQCEEEEPFQGFENREYQGGVFVSISKDYEEIMIQTNERGLHFPYGKLIRGLSDYSEIISTESYPFIAYLEQQTYRRINTTVKNNGCQSTVNFTYYSARSFYGDKAHPRSFVTLYPLSHHCLTIDIGNKERFLKTDPKILESYWGGPSGWNTGPYELNYYLGTRTICPLDIM